MSLVVTIIVLLILSGVTITSIVGNGGLMSKAQDISTSTKRIQIVSQLKTDILTEQLDGDITKGQLEEILTAYGDVQYDDDGDITGVYVDDIDDVIDIDEVFTGTLAEEITDTTAPVATIELSSTSTSIGVAVTAIVAHIDSETGVDITNCKYIYNSSSEKLGTTNTSWDSATSFSSNPQTLSLSASTMGTYYLHVLTADLAGNIEEAVSDAISVVDTTAPTVEINLSSTTTVAGTGITAEVTITDNDSRVDITNCKYIYNTTSSAIGTTSTSWDSATSFSSNPQTLTLSTSTMGTYYLHILSVDESGNTAEVISSAITVKEKLVADGSFSVSKGVNTPNLGTGMTPIKYDEDAGAWVKTTEDDEDWYNYTETDKKWANVVLKGTFNDDGTLDESTTGYAMFVWIPRYAYQIENNYHTGGTGVSGTINIKFMQGTSNTAADGTTSWDNATGEGNWNIHPGFNYSSTAAGIWVAKFEASNTSCTTTKSSGQYNGTSRTLQVKAGVTCWSYISANYIYTVCLNYNTTLNSHMMKNSEWGAVAYLAQSVYGKNSEVWINPNSNLITGQAGTSVSASSTTSTYTYTNTTYGVNASTTGNVYGIYDMSGGAWEYVAAYVNTTYMGSSGSLNSTTYAKTLIAGASYTKDVYSVGTSDTRVKNYAANASVYGDAMYETSLGTTDDDGATVKYSWYGDHAGYGLTNYPVFFRGGQWSGTTAAGLFFFHDNNGEATSSNSFRPVLIVF